jgi:hypothetical protein
VQCAWSSGHSATVIAFDPATDFTVSPWLRTARRRSGARIDAFLAGGTNAGVARTTRAC